ARRRGVGRGAHGQGTDRRRQPSRRRGSHRRRSARRPPPRHRRAPLTGPPMIAPAASGPATRPPSPRRTFMMRLSRVITVATVALLAGLALPPDAHAQKTFKMGAIVPVSGPAAAFGLGVQRGMEFAAEDIGTLTVGGDKYKIEVVTYDTVYDPGKTVAAMNRAVYNDGVKYGIIIGAG